MNYAQPELLRHLAAEYVLGTLRGPARRRFERLMQQQVAAQEHVDFWEFRLSEFGQAVAPVCPPASARDALLRRASPPAFVAPISAPAAASTAHPRLPVSQRRLARRRRRWLTAGAAAAALVAAFLVGQNNSRPALQQAPLEIASVAVPAALAPGMPAATGLAEPQAHAAEPDLYLAQLKLPASSMGWLLSMSRDHRKLSVIAADDLLTMGRHTLQLWWISPDRGPIALAVLPAQRDAMTIIDLPADILNESQVIFAISMEPEGGSRSGKPSGPVLSATPQIDTI